MSKKKKRSMLFIEPLYSVLAVEVPVKYFIIIIIIGLLLFPLFFSLCHCPTCQVFIVFARATCRIYSS